MNRQQRPNFWDFTKNSARNATLNYFEPLMPTRIAKVYPTSSVTGDAHAQKPETVSPQAEDYAHEEEIAEVGKTYLGKVVHVADFGAFVEISPTTDGYLHISQIATYRVKDVKDELREGDEILVKVLSIEGGRLILSRRAVLQDQRRKLGLEPDEAEDGLVTNRVRPGRRIFSRPPFGATDSDRLLVETPSFEAETIAGKKN